MQINPANSKMVTVGGLALVIGNFIAELHGVTTGGLSQTLYGVGGLLMAIGKGIFASGEGGN